MSKYTKKELATLRRMRKTGTPVSVIARTLGRTADAVRIKANRLGYHSGSVA